MGRPAGSQVPCGMISHPVRWGVRAARTKPSAGQGRPPLPQYHERTQRRGRLSVSAAPVALLSLLGLLARVQRAARGDDGGSYQDQSDQDA
jgi:hypothetical protein